MVCWQVLLGGRGTSLRKTSVRMMRMVKTMSHLWTLEVELGSLTAADVGQTAQGKTGCKWNAGHRVGLKLGVEPSKKAWKQSLGIVSPLTKFIHAFSLSTSCLSWEFCTASWMECGAKEMEKLNHQRLCHLSKIKRKSTVMSELTGHRVVRLPAHGFGLQMVALSVLHSISDMQSLTQDYLIRPKVSHF